MSDTLSAQEQRRRLQRQEPGGDIVDLVRREVQDREVYEISDDESDELDDQNDEETSEIIRHFFDFTNDDEDQEILSHQLAKLEEPRTPSHQKQRPSLWKEIIEYQHGNMKLRARKVVELFTKKTSNSKFLFVCQILQHASSSKVQLSGFLLYRNTSLPMLPPKLNEIYLIVDHDLDEPQPLYKQGIVTVDVADTLRIRRVVFTHEGYPAFSFRSHHRPEFFLSKTHQTREIYREQRQIVQEEGELVCRYVLIARSARTKNRRKNVKMVIDSELRRLYQGETPLQYPTNLRRRIINDMKAPETGLRVEGRLILGPPSKRPRFIYNSGYAGGGGDCEGARLAGCKVTLAWDSNSEACLTLEINHKEAIVLRGTADQMCNAAEGLIAQMVDIVHLSPPCQFFSPAHTRLGKNDDANIAALFAVEAYLKKTQPRIVTIEETSGLETHHPVYFRALISMIIAAGYNVRSTVKNFYDYGLASSRKRLLIFGAQIGLPIPRFPAKTHGEGPGLQPFNSISNAISLIPQESTWHLDSVQKYAIAEAPYDGNRPAKCITTEGNIPHPDGTRHLSLRELACVNGFPTTYKFPSRAEISRRDIRRIIGNAVPPLVWKTFVASIMHTLQSWDDGHINEAGDPIASRDRDRQNPPTRAIATAFALRPSPGPSIPPTRRSRKASRSLSPATRTAFTSQTLKVTPKTPQSSRKRRLSLETPMAHVLVTYKTRTETPQSSRKRRIQVDLETGAAIDLNTGKEIRSVDLTQD